MQKSKFLSPQNEVRDMSIIQFFTATMGNTKTTDYEVIIKKMSDNSVAYTTGKKNLSTPLAKDQLLSAEIPAGSAPNGLDYKWSLKTYNGAESIETREFAFSAYSNPTLVMNVPSKITSEKYTFSIAYTQAEGIEVNYFKFILMNQDGDLIKKTENVFGFDISHEFDGLINENSYRVQGVVTNLLGVETKTSVSSFNVEYSGATFSFEADVSVDNRTSFSTLTWSEPSDIVGVASGTVDLNEGNILIQAGASVLFSPIPMTADTVVFHKCKIESGFNGDILDLGNGYTFGYDSSISRFYMNNNGFRLNTASRVLDQVFEIALLQHSFYIRSTAEPDFEYVE